MTHPSFEFFLEAVRYLREQRLEGEWRPVKISLRLWRLERVAPR